MPPKPDWWYSEWNIFEKSMDDVAELVKKSDVVMIPVGSCEQHGPHGLVSTDSLGAWITVKWAAEKARVPHTPLVWVGYSPHHLRHVNGGSGTITIRASTFENLLYDIGRSLIHQGFDKLIYVTGHTSNIKIIDPVLRRIRYDTGALAVLFRADAEFIPLVPRIRKEVLERPPEENPGWHAGEVETSLCLLYNPDAVNLSRATWARSHLHAPKWLPQDIFTKKDGDPYVIFKGQDKMIMMPMEHHEYCDTGTVGNPLGASAEKGEKIYRIMSSLLAEFIEELKKLRVDVKQREFVERI